MPSCDHPPAEITSDSPRRHDRDPHVTFSCEAPKKLAKHIQKVTTARGVFRLVELRQRLDCLPTLKYVIYDEQARQKLRQLAQPL
jgi:hypothetical protein